MASRKRGMMRQRSIERTKAHSSIGFAIECEHVGYIDRERESCVVSEGRLRSELASRRHEQRALSSKLAASTVDVFARLARVV